MLLTFEDVVIRLIDYVGGAQTADVLLRDAKKAAIEALRELIQAHSWTYLYSHGRVQLVPPYAQGEVTYAADDAFPYQLTLTGGVWPEWAALGTIRINNINYEIDRRISSTIVTLKPPMIPAEDITAPVGYSLYLDSYSLPSDFAEIDQAFIPMNWGDVRYVHPREWLWERDRWGLVGNPLIFTIMADPDFGGRLALKVSPFPQLDLPMEFLYKRHANPLRVFRANNGTVTTAAGSSTIVGTSTAFTSDMVNNCVLRISGTPKLPTAEWGDNPAVFESKIIAVDDAQRLVTWDAIPAEYLNAPYSISSYLDIETGAMEQAYLRCCEKHIGISRILKDKPSAARQYEQALEISKCADSRSMIPRVAGIPQTTRLRLRNYPINLGNEY